LITSGVQPQIIKIEPPGDPPCAAGGVREPVVESPACAAGDNLLAGTLAIMLR
jgi:hypothetical protein